MRSPKGVGPCDAVVNRISTRVARKQPDQAEAMQAALERWEDESRLVINGADCLELGFSKWAQVVLKHGSKLPDVIAGAVAKIVSRAKMELGSVEYLLDAEDLP